jgi:hypothetical protein
MPTNHPSNAPDNIGSDARDDANPASVIADERLDEAPGGGGLGGAAAAAGAPDHARPEQAATPNTPASAPVPDDAADLHAADEAITESVDDTPEAHLRSQ